MAAATPVRIRVTALDFHIPMLRLKQGCCLLTPFQLRSISRMEHACLKILWASGAMDNASDYGSGDSRFDSWLARQVFIQVQRCATVPSNIISGTVTARSAVNADSIVLCNARILLIQHVDSEGAQTAYWQTKLPAPTCPGTVPEVAFTSNWSPIWSSGQDSWFSPRRPGFDSRYGNVALLGRWQK